MAGCNKSNALRFQRWHAIAASIFVMMLDYGFLYALGTIFVPMLDKFGETRSKTAAIQSIFNGTAFMASTLTGLFVARWGATRGLLVSSVLIPLGFFTSFFAKSVLHLYVTLGILGGIGNSFVFVSLVVAVGQLYPRSNSQRSMALSVLMTSMGVASMIYPYFLDWLLVLYGLNGAFLILSGLYLNTWLATIIFHYEVRVKPSNENSNGKPDANKDISFDSVEHLEPFSNDDTNMDKTKTTCDSRQGTCSENYCKQDDAINGTYNHEGIIESSPEMDQSKGAGETDGAVSTNYGLCSVTFFLFCIASAMIIGNITGFVTLAQDIYTAKGISKSEILSGFLTFNICNTISRLAPGFASRCKANIFTVCLISALLGLIGQILILLLDSFVPLMVGSGLSGMALGGYASALLSATFEVLGPRQQAIGFGLIVTLNGICVTGVGPVFGAMRDATGDYSYVLMTTSSLSALCLIIISGLFVKVFLDKRQQSSQKP